MQAVLKASNKWNYNFYKSVEEMPPDLRRLEIYTPYNNVKLMYNPNDPAEIKSFLAQKRARKIRYFHIYLFIIFKLFLLFFIGILIII